MEAVNKLIEKAPEGEQEKITTAITKASKGGPQKSLFGMTIFPLIMLIAYVLMFLYFRSKGGYKPLELGGGGESPAPSGDDESSSSDD